LKFCLEFEKNGIVTKEIEQDIHLSNTATLILMKYFPNLPGKVAASFLPHFCLWVAPAVELAVCTPEHAERLE